MTKTKEIIQELLENYCIEKWRSLPPLERVNRLISQFGCSRGVAYNVSNRLSMYSAECLFNIYGDFIYEKN